MTVATRGSSAASVRVLPASRVFHDEGFPLHAMVIDQFDLDRHRHDFTEIVVVLDGVGDHLFDERVYPICAGDVFAVDKSHAHGYRNTQALRIANVLFDEPFLTARAPWVERLAGYQALVHLEPTLRKQQAFGGKLRLGPQAMARAGELVRRLLEELRGAARATARWPSPCSPSCWWTSRAGTRAATSSRPATWPTSAA